MQMKVLRSLQPCIWKRSLTYLDLIVGSIIPKMIQMVWLIRSAWLVSFAKALPTSTSLIYTTTPLENLTTVTQLGTYDTTSEINLWFPTLDLKFTTTVMISVMTNEQFNPTLFVKYRWNKHRTWSRLARWKICICWPEIPGPNKSRSPEINV